MADRKAISTATRLRLFANASGYCQKPDCLDALFPAEMGGDKHIAEMAHVIPHGDTGPRHEDRPADDFDADTFENLILLCPTCHTKVDKTLVPIRAIFCLSGRNVILRILRSSEA